MYIRCTRNNTDQPSFNGVHCVAVNIELDLVPPLSKKSTWMVRPGWHPWHVQNTTAELLCLSICRSWWYRDSCLQQRDAWKTYIPSSSHSVLAGKRSWIASQQWFVFARQRKGEGRFGKLTHRGTKDDHPIRVSIKGSSCRLASNTALMLHWYCNHACKPRSMHCLFVRKWRFAYQNSHAIVAVLYHYVDGTYLLTNVSWWYNWLAGYYSCYLVFIILYDRRDCAYWNKLQTRKNLLPRNNAAWYELHSPFRHGCLSISNCTIGACWVM